MPGMRRKESHKGKNMTKLEELKKEYKDLEKKFKLPGFEDLDREFEIKGIDLEKVDLLNALTRVVRDTIGMYINLLETVVSPNPSWLHSMIEVNNLSEKEKDDMLKFYYEIMVYYHDGYKVLLGKDNGKAEYIVKIFNLHTRLREESSSFLAKISSAWEKALKELNQEKKSGFLR